MRIAFFTDTYHPAVDGVVRGIDVFAQSLRARGHTVRIFAPGGPRGTPEMPDVVRATPTLPFPPYPQYRIPLHLGPLLRQAEEFEPDIIHSHAMLPLAWAARHAAWSAGAPLVGTFHTLLPSAMQYLFPTPALQDAGSAVGWRYLRHTYRAFDALIAPSRFMQAELERHRIPSTVVPTPVDTARFKPGRPLPAVGRYFAKARAGGAPALLYLGRVASEKNLDFLLDMAATPAWRRWGARLIIAGKGPHLAALKARAAREDLEGHVLFHGPVPEAQLASFYRAADGVLLPSRFETQGLVALEAMACGAPVAAPARTALAELIAPGRNGLLLPAAPSAAVAAARRLVSARPRLAPAARRTAQEYSIPACTDRLLEVYKTAQEHAASRSDERKDRLL